jgi:hypothetical protein
MKNGRLKLFFSLTFICFFALLSFAQTGDIRGFVYEKESSEPSPYVSVYLKGTTYGAQTNLDGFFSITRIPPGDYTLMVTAIGYDTIAQPIIIKGGDLISKKFYQDKSVIIFKEVEISAEKEEKKTDVQISVQKITPKEIRQVPTIGGEPDLAQYLQVLPGVITSGDQGGQLYIRGGTPIQNKVLLDGMVIYNPFHSIGFFSVFDPDIIRGIDVYTGGFNAEYGGRLSSVMDITTRDGNKNRFGGKVSATTFNSKLILEGPIKKQKEEGGTSSYILEGKTSYLDKSSKVFYSYVDSAGLPYNFNDLYGKISFNGVNGSKFNLFGFHFADNVNYQHVADLHWTNLGFGTNFVVVPGSTASLIEGNFAYSKYNIELKEADDRPRTSEIKGFNMGLQFTYFIGRDEIKYGFDILGNRTNFEYYNFVGLKGDQTQNVTDLAGYLKYKNVGKRLVLEPGFRLNYYAALSEFSSEPRLGLKLNITDRLRFKAAGGFYSQNLLAATSERDIVNLFYGFLTGSDELPSTFKGEEVSTKLQKAKHGIAGFEYDFPWHIQLNIEGYIKDFTQLESVNRDKLFEDNIINSNKPDYLKKDYIIETGLARGVDLTLKYEYKRLYVWAVYSYGYVTRTDELRTYFPFFDRRHNVNLVVSYKFGKHEQWETNVRWNLGSPFPFTLTQAFYEKVTFPDGFATDIIHQNGNIGIYYDELNKGRLTYYHRLDASVRRIFKLSKNSTLDITGSVTNAYDRDNIFYVNRITGTRVYQLPILPSLGASLTF